MRTQRIEQLYHCYIEPIPVTDQLRLITLITQHLATQDLAQKETKTRSLLELEGLGAETWQGIDAQEYVDALRDEWEAHS